jgi:hypothetical protein
LSPEKQDALWCLKCIFSTNSLRLANKIWTNFTCFIFSVKKCSLSQQKLWKWDKNRMTSKHLILFNAYFEHWTDGIKSQNINKYRHNVTYNYQMSKCHLNFDTLLNFQGPFWPYEIDEHFLTSPFEHTVLYWI